jgi:hypothetical protein
MSTAKSKKTRRKAAIGAGNGPAVRHGRPDSGEAFLPDPTEARPHVHSQVPLANLFGEDTIRAATSGEDPLMDDLNAVTEEETRWSSPGEMPDGRTRGASAEETFEDGAERSK